MLWQPRLPDEYLARDPEETAARIESRRRELGDRLLVLGHHYQQDDVIRHADLTGDSLKLSRMAAEEARRRGTEFIVFCGVHFMAETADIVTDDSVQVLLPDLSAGCSMADMAQWDDVNDCWDALAAIPGGRRIVPVTYVNSSAAVKAFVGMHDGACCTSSNAGAVFDWARAGGERPEDGPARVLFLPDGDTVLNAIGKPSRRFFAVGDDEYEAFDGTIVGWLPAEGEDEPLWHMVHADGDDEDLDEREVAFAVANFANDRKEPSDEEKAYIKEVEEAAKEEEGEGGDGDGDGSDGGEEEDDEESESDSEGGGGGKHSEGLLWSSLESRTRWQNALRGAPKGDVDDDDCEWEGPASVHVVALALTALRQRARVFRPLFERPKRPREHELDAWHHAKAFKVKAGREISENKKRAAAALA